MAAHDAFVQHRDLIEHAIQVTCRRHRLYPPESDDFASVARLHFLEGDGAVLRAFEGRSTLQTYVITVLARLFLDWRNAQWGKWRPSAEARRLGPLAIRLETFLVRDGWSFEEAYEALRTNLGVAETRAQLEALAGRFVQRVRRRLVSADELTAEPASGGAADVFVLARESAATADQASRILAECVRALPPEDRLMLKMRFEDGCSIAVIARALGADQKPLYRRFERLLSSLRETLERAGITATSAAAVLDQRAFDGLNEFREMTDEVRPSVGRGRSPADARVR